MFQLKELNVGNGLPGDSWASKNINAADYAKTRNFIDVDVTRLSPYISRGVLSTKQVLEYLLDNGHEPNRIEKFIQELAWRDYWQLIWIDKGDEINSDLKRPQQNVANRSISKAILEAQTGVYAVDEAINELYQTGYMHNHHRMYVAAIACNMAFSHWKTLAQWMYYHLLDGDWASNALSWQWVAGSNSNKKYVANQKNINKYSRSDQSGTFLDVYYEAFSSWTVPQELIDCTDLELKTTLPFAPALDIEKKKATAIYTYYNLDPSWLKDQDLNRVLLLEPSHFDRYPVGEKAIGFMMALTKNIPRIQLFVGEFNQLQAQCGELLFKEHPTNTHFEGRKDERDWMFSVKGYYPSFFAYWKKCKKELR